MDRAARNLRLPCTVGGAAALLRDLLDRRHLDTRQILVVYLRAVLILQRSVGIALVQFRVAIDRAAHPHFFADQRLEPVGVGSEAIAPFCLVDLLTAHGVAARRLVRSARADAGPRMVHFGEDVVAAEIALL